MSHKVKKMGQDKQKAPFVRRFAVESYARKRVLLKGKRKLAVEKLILTFVF